MNSTLLLATGALLAAATSPTAAAQANVELRFEGSVSAIGGTLQAPFDAAAAGDPVTIVYDVVAPGTVNGDVRTYPVDPASVSVTVGTAVDTFATGSTAALEVLSAAGFSSLTGRVPLAGGLQVEPLLFDLDPVLFLTTNDLTQLFGTYTSADLDLSFLNLIESFAGIQIEIGTFTIGPGSSAGNAYCGPAVPSSIGQPAELSAVGSASVAANDLVLQASSLPNNSFGLFLASTEQAFVPNPGGSRGNLCLGGAIGRYTGPGQIQSSGTTGAISLPVDWAAVPQPTALVQATAGETWNFQLWYRDFESGLPVSNFSDGYAITLQ